MKLPGFRPSIRQSMVLIAAFALGLAISPQGAPYLAFLPPLALWVASFRYWPLAMPTIFLLVLCATCEILVALPVPGWVYAPIAIVLSGLLWPRAPLIRRPKSWFPLIAVNALILALFLIPWTTRKPFLRQLYSIKPGMTLAEVKRIMAGYKEGTGITMPNAIQEFSPSGAIVFRHSDDGAFNADWGIVTIQEGKVVDVSFSPD